MEQRLLLNRKTPVVSYTLAILSVLIFLADAACEYLIYGIPLLTVWGVKENTLILVYRQWWRLFTPMFLHSGVMHLVCNMAGLVIWGRQCEALLGRARFLLVYCLAGVMGSAASLCLSSAMSVGASGAIFGLFGALLMFRRNHREIFNRVFGTSVALILIVNLLNGFITPNIDNFGHLGGLLGGWLACGATGFYGQKGQGRARLAFALGFVFALAVLIVGAYLRFF